MVLLLSTLLRHKILDISFREQYILLCLGSHLVMLFTNVLVLSAFIVACVEITKRKLCNNENQFKVYHICKRENYFKIIKQYTTNNFNTLQYQTHILVVRGVNVWSKEEHSSWYWQSSLQGLAESLKEMVQGILWSGWLSKPNVDIITSKNRQSHWPWKEDKRSTNGGWRRVKKALW